MIHCDLMCKDRVGRTTRRGVDSVLAVQGKHKVFVDMTPCFLRILARRVCVSIYLDMD